MSDLTDLTKLPKYRAHKVVQAAKITGIDTEKSLVMLGDLGHADVGKDWLRNRIYEHGILATEAVGGYFVRYEDGYTSFSPAKAFDGGYTRVEEPAA